MLIKNCYSKPLLKPTLRTTVACLAAGFYLLLSTVHTQAEQLGATVDNPFFLPDTVYLRNPFKNESDGNKAIHFDSSFGMDNDDLLRAATDIQDISMSTSQRLLNYQWLSTYEDGSKSRHGGKAISQIFLTGLKTFWDNRYGSKLYKGNLLKDKHGNYYQEMDYRIRLSEDSVKMSLEYSF